MLQFTPLSTAFPRYRDTRDYITISNPHRLLKLELSEVLDMKDNDKLRVKNGKLYIDNRKNQWFKRYWTKDSRWKVLEVLTKLLKQYSMDFEDLSNIVRTLYNTTYKKDAKWRQAMEEAAEVDLQSDLERLEKRKEMASTLTFRKRPMPKTSEVGPSEQPPPYSVDLSIKK